MSSVLERIQSDAARELMRCGLFAAPAEPEVVDHGELSDRGRTSQEPGFCQSAPTPATPGQAPKRTDPSSSGDARATAAPTAELDRFRLAKSRFEMWGGWLPQPMRYAGHDVSQQPRDDHGRWARDGTIHPPQPKQATGPGPDDRQSGQPAEPKLTLEQKKALWAKQAEISRLMEGVRNFEKDLKNPNLSPGHRRSLERALDECRQNLTQKIIEANGITPTGDRAKGLDPVARMTLTQKLDTALRLAISSGKLSQDVQEKLQKLLQPENLAAMVAFMGAYMAAHASPAAPFLAVVDAYMLGSAATETGTAIFQAYLDLSSATTPQELEEASKNLSELLSGPIVDALVKVAVGGAGKGAAAFNKRYKVSVKIDPNTLRMNLGNVKVKITKRKATSAALVRTANKSRVHFDGIEVRSVRDLSHVNVKTLREMLKKGKAARDTNGNTLSLHHVGQNHRGPLVEMPSSRNNVHNRVQHPRGNAKGAGLTRKQRREFNDWRKKYWKARAAEELQ